MPFAGHHDIGWGSPRRYRQTQHQHACEGTHLLVEFTVRTVAIPPDLVTGHFFKTDCPNPICGWTFYTTPDNPGFNAQYGTLPAAWFHGLVLAQRLSDRVHGRMQSLSFSQRIAFGLRVLALVVGIGVPLYWWATFSGLYRWLAEVQIGWFEGYYAILTGLISTAVFLGAMVLMILPLATLMERKKEI